MAAKKPAKAAPKKAAAKAAPKKAAAKAAPKKAAPKKAAAKPTPVGGARWGKSQILNELAARAEVSRKQATAILEELGSIIARHLHKSGPGLFVLPGMFKVSTRKKAAVKAGPRKHPITGETIMGKAKPASITVRVRPLKKLKDMAN